MKSRTNAVTLTLYQPLVEWKTLAGALENSADPDEMPLFAAFYQGLHYFKDKLDLQRKKMKKNEKV